MRWSILVLAGCAAPERGRPVPVPVTVTVTPSGSPGPSVLAVSVEPPNERAWLARVLHVETDVPVRLEVSWESRGETTTRSFDDLATVHDVPLLGFRVDRIYNVTVTVVSEDGVAIVADPVTTVTDPLPSKFPSVTVYADQVDRCEPGLTLLPLRLADSDGGDAYIAVIDALGEPLWLFDAADKVTDIRMTPEGTLLGLEGGRAVEWDLLGNELVAYKGTVDAGLDGTTVLEGWGFHHDIARLESGNLLGLSSDERVLDLPVDYVDPELTQPVHVLDDFIVEFDRAGQVVREIHASDLIPARVGYGSLDLNATGVSDWVHANGVVYDAAADAFVLSLRSQDAVLKLDRVTGELIWILGNHHNWEAGWEQYLLTPVGALEWQYHQHAPELGADGRVLLFDNGNHRASPYTTENSVSDARNASRVVEFQVDERQMQVTQRWALETTPAGTLYAYGMGDADYLPNGNVFGTFGAVSHQGGVLNANLGLGDDTVHLVEFVPGPDPEVLCHLRLAAPRGVARRGWTANRASRIPSLYGTGG